MVVWCSCSSWSSALNRTQQRLQQQHQQAWTLREHSTAAVGFHFGGRPHKRNCCFVLTSLHRRSGVALPTAGRADPAVGNEALAGTRRSFFFSLVPGARWYPTLKPRQFFHTKTKISRTSGGTYVLVLVSTYLVSWSWLTQRSYPQAV